MHMSHWIGNHPPLYQPIINPQISNQEECHLYHFRLIFLDHLPQLPNWGSYSIALYLHLKGVSRKALECADISGVERRVLNSLKVEGGHALVECGKRDAKTGMITDQFCIVFDAGDVNIPIITALSLQDSSATHAPSFAWDHDFFYILFAILHTVLKFHTPHKWLTFIIHPYIYLFQHILVKNLLRVMSL